MTPLQLAGDINAYGQGDPDLAPHGKKGKKQEEIIDVLSTDEGGAIKAHLDAHPDQRLTWGVVAKNVDYYATANRLVCEGDGASLGTWGKGRGQRGCLASASADYRMHVNLQTAQLLPCASRQIVILSESRVWA